tara:strand:+ start:581 stop:1393 length:813 start_codon:yes stop_codon:yes gene_type:complete
VNKQNNFTEIVNSNKIWAIGSIHSRLDSFNNLKKYILDKFEENDYLIFLGNIIGLGNQSKETLTSVIDLRNKLMSKFYINPERVIFLRGAQEEMFLKLLQLQTAPNPQDIVNWMFEHGVDKTIQSYGFESQEVISVSTRGTLAITKWTKKLNQVLLNIPDHKQYFNHLKHAAYSDSKKILFLNRGVDVSRPLSAQNDCFWWGYQNFSNLNKPYNTFIRIVRGYKSSETKPIEDSKNNVVCSLFKQPLNHPQIISGIFRDSGEIVDLFESN